MTVGLTSLVSSASRCGAGGSGRGAKRNQAASHLMSARRFLRAGYARGGGEQREGIRAQKGDE